MHIPDGWVDLPTSAAAGVVAAGSVAVSARRAQAALAARATSLPAVVAAYLLVAQLLVLPVGLGTSAHLVGTGLGPTPVEVLLHAIAACLTAGIANVAAARGVPLRAVSSTVEGDINLLGILGLSDQVRNGYEGIRVTFQISGEAPDEVLRGLVKQSQARSAVYDVLTNGVPVSIDVTTG